MTYRTVRKLAAGHTWGIFVGGFSAAWLSIEVAALCAAFQLAFSGTSPANIAIPAMAGIHALIGIGEGLITTGTLAFIYSGRRDLITAGHASTVGGRVVWLAGLLIALVLAIVSPLASSYPDGLEWVAGRKGFLEKAQGPIFRIIPDYLFPGISNQTLATILAGILGTLMVLGVTLAVAITQRNRHSTGSQ
jgi:cobalt/nickel transport system permease protein